MPRKLDHRAAALRLSLLASLGLVPIACGGTTRNQPGDDGGNENGGTSSNTGGKGTGKAGSSSKGGSTSAAGSTGKGGSSSTAGAGGANQEVTCTSPTVNPVSGLVSCDEGYTHRPVAKICGENLGGAPSEGGAGPVDQHDLPRVMDFIPCTEDTSVCAQFQYGYCETGQGGPVCASGCATDLDCGAEGICLCGNANGYGVCTAGNCKTDADCGPGLGCASYSAGCGGGYACQTPKDSCVTQAQCKAGETCQPGVDGARVCYPAAVCGRPFLVAAEARFAPLVPSSAWRGRGEAPRVDHLTSEERAAQAAHWAHLGQLEHASIAAFARFNLQLLSLGAPPELVEACTRALGDETAHTKLCFELASAYAGHAIGPGPLQIEGSLAATSLEEILDLVIAEGCFGETGAALDALRAADQASDPVIRAAYTQIANDEQRHAELAFKFVRWALRSDYATARRRVMAALTQPSPSAATEGVVAPCLEALLFADEAA